MTMPSVAENSKSRHRGHRLNHDHAVKNQVPQRKRTPQAWPGTRPAFVVQALSFLRTRYALQQLTSAASVPAIFNRFNADSVRNPALSRNCNKVSGGGRTPPTIPFSSPHFVPHFSTGREIHRTVSIASRVP